MFPRTGGSLTGVAQKTEITVDKNGIRTDSGTVLAGVLGGIVTRNSPFEMTLDRPFLFIIRDNVTGVLPIRRSGDESDASMSRVTCKAENSLRPKDIPHGLALASLHTEPRVESRPGGGWYASPLKPCIANLFDKLRLQA